MSRNRSRNRPRTSTEVTNSVKAAVPGAAGNYSFVYEGKAYAIPPASSAAPNVPAGVLIDAVKGGDAAELNLGIAMLEASGVSQTTMDVLRSMPMVKFTEHLSAWMTNTGVAPGESVSSSS